MPDIIAKYMKWSAGGEVPDQFNYWAWQSAASTYIGRRIVYNLRYQLWPAQYVCIVSPSGVARKSTAAEDAVNIVKDAIAKEKNIDATVPIVLEEPTRAALLSTLGIATEKFGSTPPALLYNDEAGNLFKDPEFVRTLDSLYTGRRGYGKETKGNGIDVLINHSLCILTCTTPSWLGSASEKYGFGEGSMGRFIFPYAIDRQRKVAWPESLPEREVLRNEIISDLRALRHFSGTMLLDDEPKREFKKWYESYEAKDKAIKASGWEARVHTHILRIAMCAATFRRQELCVRIGDMQEAFEVIQKIEDDLWRVHKNVLIDGEVREIKLIESACREAGPKGIQHTKLRNRVVRQVGGRFFDETIVHLVTSGVLQHLDKETPGRRAVWYIHSDFKERGKK